MRARPSRTRASDRRWQVEKLQCGAARSPVSMQDDRISAKTATGVSCTRLSPGLTAPRSGIDLRPFQAALPLDLRGKCRGEVCALPLPGVTWVLLALVGPINPVAWGGGPNLSEYQQ